VKHTIAVLAAVSLAALAAAGATTMKPERADAATSVRSCTGGTVSLAASEKRMLSLHNRERAERGKRRLCVHPKLQKAARAHSRDMIQRDYFSHTTKGRNENECERIRRYGYRWSACGENIGWGTGARGSADRIFNTWMKSAGHRSNILDGRFREVGIGAARGNFQGFDNATMWTVDFGRRR
jgi:uncharacterized protein YkwD